MLALALVAVSVGFSNLAASIAIGVGGVSAATRIRVLATFGLFEAGMPILGLILGNDLASDIGKEAKWIGALLLIAVGLYGVASFVRSAVGLRRARTGGAAQSRTGQDSASDGEAHAPTGQEAAQNSRRREWIKIAVSGFALSLDNLIAGFALGGYQVNLLVGAILFGVVSIGMSLAGLEFGARLGGWAGDSGELIGGIVLIGVGAAIGLGVLG